MKVYKTLADLNFSGKLFEAKAQTTTGQSFINKYQAYCINNPVSCGLVNAFMKESKDFKYDSGVVALCESIASVINENKYSWAIATSVEQINENNSKGNYLNRRAAEQVMPLLEMSEDAVVAYIKSGAFKSVMYVECFRNIAKSVYKDQPVVESNANYNMIHPISVIEKSENAIYFEALGDIYKVEEGLVKEASAMEVSNDFLVMSRLLESNNVKLVNESLVLTLENRTYTVSEAGKCIMNSNNKDLEMSVDQLRENNNIYLTTVVMNRRALVAEMLESFAKIVENYNSIGILNNVSVVNNSNDKFIVIENNGNAYAKMIQSNHTAAWKINENIATVCEQIKKYTRIDLTENYKESIDQVVESVEAEEAKQIQENLEADQMQARKQKIAELTERYKNDPVRLAMLSKIASELNEIEQ